MTDVLIVAYHAVSPVSTSRWSVTPELLRRHLEALLGQGYAPATLTDALERPSPRVLAVTFDDGFRSVREHALPVLRELGVPATAFVVTEHVERGTPLAWDGAGADETELAPLSWDDARALVAEGWEIGSHTATHPPLTQMDDAALARELQGSKRACEAALGLPCTSVAYPYGDHDARVVAAARAAGYRAGVTFPPHGDTPDPLRRGRVGVLGTDTPALFRVKSSRAVRRLRASRAWPLVRRAAGVVR